MAELIGSSSGREKELLTAGMMGQKLKAEGSREQGTAAAYFEQLSKAGLTVEPTLAADDPKLAPLQEMSFDAFVKITAKRIVGSGEMSVEQTAAELGQPQATTAAFEAWSERVCRDAEVGLSYTAALQAEIEKLS